MAQSLVSVILLCYNHELFVKSAIDSVLNQTYPAIQLIIVDDGSTDDSVSIIRSTIKDREGILFLPLDRNLGNCAAFNRGLARATGDFIIDLSADDVLYKNRIQKQIDFFATLDASYGVVFTDAEYMDEQGVFLRNHYDDLFKKRLITSIPQGDVYSDVLHTYFISSPTMMVKREVFTALGGYDETLAYEDFDFWVRSSRGYNYGFLNEKLTKIRRLKNSMSSGWYKFGDKQLHSTYLICRKAKDLNRTEEEDRSLLKRVRYELRQSVFSDNRVEAKLFYEFIKEFSSLHFVDRFMYALNEIRFPLSFFRNVYHKLFFGSR